MTTGTWDPTQGTKTASYKLDINFLNKIIQSMKNHSSHSIESILSAQEQSKHQPIMRLEKDEWFSITENLSPENIIDLIKFFTLAEMQIPSWEGEDKSPVIALTKILRQKGQPLEKELLIWIKTNSNNKFLPHGPL